MASCGQDNSQWLSVTEETLFLHDGLIRVTDLVELPHDVNTGSGDADSPEVVSFDSRSPKELGERLMTVCGTQNNSYSKLLEYRLNALRGFWTAQCQLALDEQSGREATTNEDNLWKDSEQASFSTRVSLLLVLPLLQSQSKFDPGLCGLTAELLLNCLRDCPPLSLTKEPSDCLNGLEGLLCSWLAESESESEQKPVNNELQRRNAASALVALACARGHLKTFIHSVHLLQSLPDLGSLQVTDILQKLMEMQGGQGQASSVLASKHILCWGLEDMLSATDKTTAVTAAVAAAPAAPAATTAADKEKVSEPDIGRRVTCDGKFLFVTSASGRGLVKIGTGLHGTLRGYIYARNCDLPIGHVAFGDGLLLHRPLEFDKDSEVINMAYLLDPDTLKPVKTLVRPEVYIRDTAITTVALCSDGMYFYWLWIQASPSEKNKPHNVKLDVFKIDATGHLLQAVQPCTVIQKKEEGSAKSINDALLARLRPYRSATTAATLVALTGADSQSTRKEETATGTSCGISQKTLLRTPVYCDGHALVLLTAVPGGSNSSAARSLFGSGPSLASLRSLASNLCFNVDDGQFTSRTDLIDAPTCALARGAPVAGLGLCYDAYNNLVWSCSSDWVDQFYNPGHQARHHVLTRLGIEPETSGHMPQDMLLEPSEVIKQLLQHVGSMCVHQLNSDLLQTPLATHSPQQQPVDLQNLERVYDILQKAVTDQDHGIIVCCLVILQLLFKLSVFKKERPREVDLLNRCSALVWQILSRWSKLPPGASTEQLAIQREVCRVISTGLPILYPRPQDHNNLLHKLLTEGDSVPGLVQLRDLILVDFAEQLRSSVLGSKHVRHLRLTDELVHYILKIAVKESSVLLRSCQTTDRRQYEGILSRIPMASPCLRYLMALQCHLLRAIAVHRQSEEGSSGLSTHKKQAQEQEPVQELQASLLSLASKVFSGAYQVLEVLLETCNSIINSSVPDMEFWLQGLERVTKATILGHLLPVLLTAMTYIKLRCLPLADALMPQLVQLVVLTSQAALLLKSQVQAVRQDDLIAEPSDTDIVDLIGEACTLESLDIEEQEEQGFLSGLKIPAPWTSGKTVETIHPVRDNYKFKETVHIPGARCLYIRFDPRCTSQYDYDKLVVYAGPNTSARKLAEYGGNTFGYGSRSVLGSGWPKDLVKVDGDTVTFSFEMRSGREHNTPDKAMWGFLVTVRAQESAEEVSNGLPFLADLALGLSVLACTMLHLLYQGPETTKDEDTCQHLLKSKLLQRCVWQAETSSLGSELSLVSPVDLPIQEDKELSLPPSPGGKSLPRIRLPAEIVNKLCELTQRKAPHIRPSVREVLKISTLEENILSAVIKHLSLTDTVRHLGTHQERQTEDYFLLKDVVCEVYRRLDAMVRQLMALAEMENKWQREVEDIRQGQLQIREAFFLDYHLIENKTKELAIMCFLKDIDIHPSNLEQAVAELREKLETELASESLGSGGQSQLLKTQAVVTGLLERLTLLLQVTIAPEGGMGLSRSMSHMLESPKQIPSVMVRSDTDVLKSGPAYIRSLSAPSDIPGVQDDSVLDIIRLQRKRQAQKGPTSILQDLLEQEERDKPPHVILIDQLFSFIGSDPEKAVSSDKFLAAARVRCRRGNTRQRALVHMKELLTAATRVGGATHLVAAVTSVLQHGPRVDELTCGGVANCVREAFAETMTSVVQLAARYPIACCNSIGLLCIIPYTRAEEKCLVRSGLVHLLDRLCSLSNQRGSDSGSGTSDSQTTRQKVSAMAWAGFQVLSNRCVTWEQEDGAYVDELEHSGLARQVSCLLTNHLARATEFSGNEAAGTEALQEVLSLLNNLSRSGMGKAILSQPGCVSRLLSLLLDQRPSPKLVLIILELCRVALPLMTAEDCDKVELPTWGQDLHNVFPSPPEGTHHEKPLKITSLLLARLGDFLVPGGQPTVSSRRPSTANLHQHMGLGMGNKDKDDLDVQDGRLSVFVHKREDQSSHEVIQPLLSSSDSRPFRLAGGANMEKVVRMDREMTKHGRAEVSTEDAVSALRRAAKWAQMGLIVSTGPPIDCVNTDTSGNDKKKTATEVICKEKNAELARTDPVRPFTSAHVANSMAAEVIALLHGLLAAPETLAAQTWVTAVEKVISHALSSLPVLLNSVDDMTSARCCKDQLMSVAKQANAALAALGGFVETIKPGCQVQICGEGIHDSVGTVLRVSEQTGLSTVKLQPQTTPDYQPARWADTVTVLTSRLQPPRNEPLPLDQLSTTEAIVAAIQSLLLPQNGSGSPMSQPLPIHGSDGNQSANQICRVVAEIRTRACRVLANHLKDLSFASAFIQHSSAAIDILKSLAQDCPAGERACVTESQCHRLRMLYRDCAKPPAPPSKVFIRPAREITWDTSRSFPAVRSSLFSHSVTGVTFLGDPNAGSGLPRGTLVYASQPVPSQAPSFYWELEICSFGDTQDDTGPIISFGFMPAAEKKDGAWTNPVGTCLFHNNGRAVHYNGSSLLLWRSVRLDVSLNSGDVAGIGWERAGDSPPLPGQTVRGMVYFTHNGRRLTPTLEDVSGNMWPVVHIQKKNTRIKANFGGRHFAYADGTQHRNAADECHDTAQDFRETFGALPFHLSSDSESEGPAVVSSSSSDTSREVKTPPDPPCRTASVPRASREYNSELPLHYKLLPCYENFTSTGPDQRCPQSGQDDESDMEDQEDDQSGEDHYALLVKAWEQKVFPTIRRRFRNEAERKDGLEQIRGALQLGMTDIARQTVEFLYEENGGMPRDLHLPTIDDIKEELAKFTFERVRKGTIVLIRQPAGGATVLPKFAVRGMMKTFGLTGIVLDVEQPNELVQVETYLRSEGVLVRFWYPLDMLERPPQGYRRSAIVGHQVLDTGNIYIHRELLKCESMLARMYCRSALLELISQCNSPAMELPTCSTSLTNAMAASAALLQELDVENLQLLSNEVLSGPQTHGCVAASSLESVQSPSACVLPHTCSLTDTVYDQSDKLKEELRVAIARAAHQGEDYLIELSNQICMCLQTAPEMFPVEEFPVVETKICTDVHFPGATLLVVSCKDDPKAIKKDTSLYKSPWARIFTYRGHRVKKMGQFSKQEVVCYPRNTSSTSNRSDQYAPVIVPAELIHIRIGVSPPPGVIVTIHGIPPQFPLAMAYIETLVSEKYNFEYHKAEEDAMATEVEGCSGATAVMSGSEVKDAGALSPWRTFDSVVIPPPVLMHILELIGGFLWRSDVAALVKEKVFHVQAQTLRVLHSCDSGLSNILPTLNVSVNLPPSMALLLQLQSELRKLYDEESKKFPSGSTNSGSAIGLGFTDYGRFSTYFHALMEVSMAVAEVSAPLVPRGQMYGSGTAAGTKGDASASPPPPAPTSPVSAAKRKKLKAKRERDRTSSLPKRSGSPRRYSESDSTASSSPSLSQTSLPSTSTSTTSVTPSSSGTSVASGKLEDMLWFHRALTMSQILRYLLYKDMQGQGVTNDAIADAAQCLTTPSAHSRLLVLSGIPTSLQESAVRIAVTRACNAHGGLFKTGLYLPTEEVHSTQQPKSTKPKTTPADSQSVSTTGQSEDPAQLPPANQSEEGLQTESGASTVTPMKRQILGFAVLEVRSKTKLESVKKALFKSKGLSEELAYSGSGQLLDDMPEEMFSVSTVAPTLLADDQGTEALDAYFLDKLLSNRDTYQLTDSAMLVVTEIFHSCFISEQRMSLIESRQESGYICLTRDQIMSQSTGNLMATFFNSIRLQKKAFQEQVSNILRRYGIPKVMDKDDSDKKGSARTKKSTKLSKEKLTMGTTSRTSARDKKLKPREEKTMKDAASSEGSSKHKELSKDEDRLLTLDGFLSYVLDKTKQDVRAVWRALFACGFDLHFERSACVDVSQAQQISQQWTVDMYMALARYVDGLCQHLAVSPARLHPHEIYLSEAELSSHLYSCLQGIPLESIRLSFALLQSLNNTLETVFLPQVDLRPALGDTYSRSIAALLAKARGLIFYDCKTVILNRVLNATAQRKPDQAAPEITLDPLQTVGGERRPPMDTHFCQAFRQLSNVSSSQLCVRLAAGGDPTYSFNVRLTGEEVHGTSGSFRHFLWQVAREMEGCTLGLFIPCPSSASQKNKGRYILKPGPMTYSEEKLLQFLGQILAISLRADIPLGLDLLSVFWKNLVELDLDPVTDLQEADVVTYTYMKKIEMAESESELQGLCADHMPNFVYTSLTGDSVQLIPNGANISVNWENRQRCVDSIRRLRLSELQCSPRVRAMKAGLASILPIQLLPIMTPLDLEMRMCGLPEVNLDFLKAHTMYQVGLMESDTHIQFFWAVLESLSQEELCKFIKFACNQERVPQTCPCRDGAADTAHVPPYPMKIAPPDGTGSPDSRFIRVETCMFMIKLPQYSTEQLMKDRLLYAIHCREDPLSG